MLSPIVIQILDRHEGGSEFRCSLKDVQGLYDIVFTGVFVHRGPNTKLSEWESSREFNHSGKINGLDVEFFEIEEKIGNGDRDLGVKLIDQVLAPFLDEDFTAFQEWKEQAVRDAEFEAAYSKSHFERSVGF